MKDMGFPPLCECLSWLLKWHGIDECYIRFWFVHILFRARYGGAWTYGEHWVSEEKKKGMEFSVYM